MSMFLGRDGNISVFRTGIFIGIVGGILIVGGIILTQIQIQQRRSPYYPSIYPGSVEVTRQEYSSGQQRVIYQSDASPEQVRDFYQEKLDDHLGQSPLDPTRSTTHVLCVRVPAAGEFTDYVEGSGNLPYYYRCAFDDPSDNPFDQSARFTIVQIEPGVKNDSQGFDNSGLTFILYDQRWPN